jgi:hypothetical protein
LPQVTDRRLTINGSASPGITIDGGNQFQVLQVASGATLTLNNLTIAHSSGSSFSSNGAAIDNEGTLSVTNSTFSSDSGGFSGAGAIDNEGKLTVTNSTLSSNFGREGGAINNGGTLTVMNSTFSDNSADGGGGIDNGGTLTITNSTFSDNSADNGGGILNDGTLTITNSTFSGNASFSGGGIANAGSASLKSTIMADSSPSNCAGTIADDGYNISDDTTCGFAKTGSANNGDDVDPLLSSAGLVNNGGPTQTIALTPGSPAINAIPLANCTDQSSPPVRLLTDQRGVIRPQFTACDIGAYEYDTARSLKTAVLDALPSLSGNSRDRQAVRFAIANLTAAVRYYWSGTSGNELKPVAGILDFLAEELAVNALAGTLISSSQLPAATIENYLFNITLADRTLAVVAIADAGGNTEASQLVANGDAQAAAGDYLAAVISYQKAWSLVSRN